MDKDFDELLRSTIKAAEKFVETAKDVEFPSFINKEEMIKSISSLQADLIKILAERPEKEKP